MRLHAFHTSPRGGTTEGNGSAPFTGLPVVRFCSKLRNSCVCETPMLPNCLPSLSNSAARMFRVSAALKGFS